MLWLGTPMIWLWEQMSAFSKDKTPPPAPLSLSLSHSPLPDCIQVGAAEAGKPRHLSESSWTSTHECVYSPFLLRSLIDDLSVHVSILTLLIFSASVAVSKRVSQPVIFVSWINSAALCVMDVRNHGRCHGDATLQYSFAARPPARRSLQQLPSWGEKKKEGGEERGDTRRDQSRGGLPQDQAEC